MILDMYVKHMHYAHRIRKHWMMLCIQGNVSILDQFIKIAFCVYNTKVHFRLFSLFSGVRNISDGFGFWMHVCIRIRRAITRPLAQ